MSEQQEGHVPPQEYKAESDLFWLKEIVTQELGRSVEITFSKRLLLTSCGGCDGKWNRYNVYGLNQYGSPDQIGTIDACPKCKAVEGGVKKAEWVR